MNYIFDTNILISYLRGDKLYEYIQKNIQPFVLPNRALISVVTLGEITSLSLQNKWGKKRIDKLQKALKEFHVIDINAKDIIRRYAEIDAYSQGRLIGHPLPYGTSSRNMGKNDLWIAATTSVTNTTLISTDKDFSHLDKKFINFLLINLNDFKTP